MIKIIDETFPSAVEQTPTNAQNVTLDHNANARLGAIINMFDKIPSDLLATVGPEYPRMLLAAHELREIVIARRTYTPAKGTMNPHLALRTHESYGHYNALSVLRQCLAKCLDQAPPEGSPLITFISPPDTRASLLADLASAERCINNGDWKAATVLGGSVIEALLLWGIQRKSAELAAMSSKPQEPPQDWKAQKLITVARQLDLIEEATKKSCELTKDFRDLIHPGAVLKHPFPCDQGTALTAIAAVHNVMRDLSKHFT